MLTKECLFCGVLLIDMIDNDIKSEANKDFEFYQQEEAGGLLGSVDDDEWSI